jgi:hypothetical protein
MAKVKKPAKLEGQDLLLHLGEEALARCLYPYKARRQGSKEGTVHCGFRFQEEVLIGKLNWETEGATEHVNLKVFAINPQSGGLDLRLDHDFKEDL